MKTSRQGVSTDTGFLKLSAAAQIRTKRESVSYRPLVLPTSTQPPGSPMGTSERHVQRGQSALAAHMMSKQIQVGAYEQRRMYAAGAVICDQSGCGIGTYTLFSWPAGGANEWQWTREERKGGAEVHTGRYSSIGGRAVGDNAC